MQKDFGTVKMPLSESRQNVVRNSPKANAGKVEKEEVHKTEISETEPIGLYADRQQIGWQWEACELKAGMEVMSGFLIEFLDRW